MPLSHINCIPTNCIPTTVFLHTYNSVFLLQLVHLYAKIFFIVQTHTFGMAGMLVLTQNMLPVFLCALQEFVGFMCNSFTHFFCQKKHLTLAILWRKKENETTVGASFS